LAAAGPPPPLLPTREFADAVHELNLAPEAAAPLVPEAERHFFYSHHAALLGPGYEPRSY
jgi:hypothetical protein